MKKLLTVVFTMLLAVSLAFAQNTGGDKARNTKLENPTESNRKPAPTTKPPAPNSGKKGHHKGGKKSKKGSSTTTPPPK